MAKKEPKWNSIVRIDEKHKKVIFHGDLSDDAFKAMVEMTLAKQPSDYKLEKWEKPERSDDQKKAAAELSKQNDEFFEKELTKEEHAIFEAIKNATVVNAQGKTVKCGFSYAKKWVNDGKMMDADGYPKVKLYKGSGKYKKEIGERSIVIELA